MRKSNHHELRALLRANPDGLTVKQLCSLTGKQQAATHRALEGMPDVYRDRWNVTPGIKPAAVYIAVPVPEDCPPPDTKSKARSPRPCHAQPHA